MLMDRQYTEQEISKQRDLIADYAAATTVADFSPGPWWGFNGVRTLVLTADSLHVLQKRPFSRSMRLRRSIALASIEQASWRTSRTWTGEEVRMRVVANGHVRGFTSKYQQGADLARRLASATG
jgi:hypothetical protein